MARQRIGLTQSQRLRLNAGLHASIRILRMDAGGLTRFLEEQAERNPFLAVKAPPVVLDAWQPRWTTAFANDFAPSIEAASPAPSLIAHVLSQIETVTRSARERHIALVLADALEPSGWLGRPLPDLALQAGCALGDAEAVLMRLQQIEPTGLFARSLSECLRLQAIEDGLFDEVMANVLDHLDLVASGDLARLSRICEVSEAEVVKRLKTIRSLDPKPGTQFDQGTAEARETDLVVTMGRGGWQLTLNRSALPTVEVLRPMRKPTDSDERANLASALGLMRMLERRNSTLLRVSGEILTRQHKVLDAGLGALEPLTLSEVAVALDLHESTVSRVVAGVSIATPMGTWMLRSLFGPKVGDASGAAIRAEIVRLVAAENAASPMTDEALTRALQSAGRAVARRTVAKYREMLKIPTAGVRRRARRR